MTLEAIRTKYPTAGYAPREGCKFCKGVGERTTKRGTLAPCICIFVEHGLCDVAAEALGNVARKIKEENDTEF